MPPMWSRRSWLLTDAIKNRIFDVGWPANQQPTMPDHLQNKSMDNPLLGRAPAALPEHLDDSMSSDLVLQSA
ncbi:hypothetical protein ZIOFF_022924 [Zingiber officinale]|uniref:Uncharacterized protein n=1 Tax=Zingiber officinale TaxID=94328 RepID=A0A8J5HMX7_ZINOF|nr:hypothetical protein ZIOFF_022924 [Zingiber officinale]